jgi:recombination protein RecR
VEIHFNSINFEACEKEQPPMSYSPNHSNVFESAVQEFSKLPGIGGKTALRLVLHLLREDTTEVLKLGHSILELKEKIHYCSSCNNITEKETCSICADTNRDHSLICIVENIRDVMAVERTRQFHGIYHVLGGIISPMDGIGPSDLKTAALEKKLEGGLVKELIFALSTTMEGDTTNFYLYRKFNKYGIRITTLARGVSIGDELEYTDELTLAKSILNRTVFETQ